MKLCAFLRLSSRGFMCDRMFWCAGGNPNQAGLREWLSEIEWCGPRTFISDGPSRDRIIQHQAPVSCSQVPCVVKLKWFWHGADASSCSDDEPRPVCCAEERRKPGREERKCWQCWGWKSNPSLTLNTQSATSRPSQTAAPPPSPPSAGDVCILLPLSSLFSSFSKYVVISD